MEKLLKVKDLAKILQVNEDTIYRHMDEIPHIKLTGLYRFRPSVIDKWMSGMEGKVYEQD